MSGPLSAPIHPVVLVLILVHAIVVVVIVAVAVVVFCPSLVLEDFNRGSFMISVPVPSVGGPGRPLSPQR